MRSTRLRSLCYDTHAAALLEMALVIPILLLLVMASLDVGRYLFLRSNLIYAAQEGAEQAAILSRTSPTLVADVQTVVRRQIPDARAAQTVVEVTHVGSVPAVLARVTIRNYPFTPITPGVGWLKGTPTTVTVFAESHYELHDL